jgi:hypothetical protein
VACAKFITVSGQELRKQFQTKGREAPGRVYGHEKFHKVQSDIENERGTVVVLRFTNIHITKDTASCWEAHTNLFGSNQ